MIKSECPKCGQKIEHAELAKKAIACPKCKSALLARYGQRRDAQGQLQQSWLEALPLKPSTPL